ncbi:hypothetical protein BJ085DRAFT_39847 [Dimargaris cristalligena]|uniref:Uncharacterized protein n=1 Tax=Dimargaris cristalligena TaxID=215637 RepID=A0A4P9ZKU1_9FUNG|nr:hypothetical protein BJ085DRAFT_39847 [Dimargaris cristalligena]|eukprot:RKP33723.1 hypothetical protein BJ085DRAFT_39847 [Dimargaris cristalligena]
MDSKPPPFAGGRPRPPTTAGARHASRSLDDFLHRVQHSAIYSSPHHHWPRKPSRTRREFRLAALELLNPSRADKFLQAVSEGNLPKVVAYLFPSLGGHHPHTLAESHLLRSTPLSSSPSSSSSSASPSFSTRPTSLGLPKFEELALDGSSLPGPSSPAPGPPFDVHSPQYLANVTDASQRSGLHIAASKGNVAILILLIRAGASVNTRDVLGNTPLHIGKSRH